MLRDESDFHELVRGKKAENFDKEFIRKTIEREEDVVIAGERRSSCIDDASYLIEPP